MIFGTATFGAGVLGSDIGRPNPLSITAIPNLSTASVALAVSGLDLSQYVTITRTNTVTG